VYIKTQVKKQEDNIYNELKYLFIEKENGFMNSILEKAKDE
jgi:hypothetical protein